MPFKRLFCFAAIGLSANGWAYVESDPAGRVTSAEFVADLRGQPRTPKADQAPLFLYKQRHAEGYLTGVMEATEGDGWCRPASIKPGELNELVWVALERSPTKNTRNAAKDIVQVLRSRFPCSQRKR